jgi:hypothetical protein
VELLSVISLIISIIIPISLGYYLNKKLEEFKSELNITNTQKMELLKQKIPYYNNLLDVFYELTKKLKFLNILSMTYYSGSQDNDAKKVIDKNIG